MDLNLSGKRALVTGSTLGIGRAIAAALLAEGASVTIPDGAMVTVDGNAGTVTVDSVPG